MPKGKNQKFKLYRLAQIMLENTDEEHYITMPEIKEKLEEYEVTADRKSIYNDLKDLEKLGIEVEGEPVGNRYHYHVVERPFELPELKLLVDAIQSSKFITQKKTNTLIKKLEKLVSKYDAQKLQRQVYVSGRIKAMNESIYYTVDAIHNAISENRKIKFQYYQWNVKKEMELRHDGAWYHISPWGLSWDDENYYLVGYDSEAELIKHYRVDKMLRIKMSTEAREGKEHFKQLDMADYAKKSFGMFGGKEKTVKLLVDNRLAGVIIDRFGKDIMLIPADENHFTVNVDVHVSKQFLGWVFSLGEQVKILSPEEVVEQMQGEVKRLVEQYNSSECYMSDVPTPFKNELPEYQEQEEHLLGIIYEKFLGSDLTEEEQKELKKIDHAMLWYDLEHLLGEIQYGEIPELHIDLDYTVRPFEEVEEEYLSLFEKIQ